LIETHPGGGQYDCLSLVEFAGDLHSVLDVNRGGGSVHVLHGRTPQSWPDWVERMLADPRRFLNEVGEAIGATAPKSLPKSTPTTLSFRYISEILTHTVGRLEKWECRNGCCDTSGYGGGKQQAWFDCFSGISAAQPPKALADGRFDVAYSYWFLLKNAEPVLCFDTGGRLYKPNGEVLELAASYANHKRVWSVIADTALELLP
jgi:hypothetical protein